MSSQVISAFSEGIVGPTFTSDGQISRRDRVGRTGAFITGAAHSDYYEQASRGKVYHACTQAVATFGTALTSTGVTFHLWNPPGSSVNLEVLHCGATILTAGTGGHLVYAYNIPTTGAAPAATQITVVNGFGTNGLGKAYSAATLPATPIAIRTLGAAITAASTNFISDYVNGSIIVPPGAVLSIQGITIVGTGLIGMTWSEVPNQG